MFADSTATSAAVRKEPAPMPLRPGRSTRLDWVAFGMFLLLAGTLALRAAKPISDPDTWWHLRLGEEFTSGSWSLAEPGSLSPFATRPWFATQWTLEVVAHYVYEAFGLAGVSWLAAFGLVMLAGAIYVSCRLRSSIFAASVVASLTLLGTMLSHGPRPQLASFIFVAIFTAAWLSTARDLKPRWWLIGLSWLWACSHGMWFLSALIGAAVVVGLLLDGRTDRSTAIRLGLVPVGGVIAAALTPVGPKLILAPLATSKMAQFITEWQPPRFSEPVPAIALLLVGIVVATWARSGSRRSWVEILLLGMALGWIVLYYRTIAVGVVMVSPLVATAIQSWLPTQEVEVRKREPLAALSAGLTILIAMAIAGPYRAPAPLEQATELNSALHTLPAGTVVYNEYVLGGWLEWKHRNVTPVVDGMTDAYEVDYVEKYMEMNHLEPGWRSRLAETGAEYALLQSDAPVAAELRRDGWAVVVRESEYLLLRRPG